MKVSVWMSAYNHEKFIGDCLDSVLSQKTNFDFDIILGEDCSTDNTREIVLSYEKKHPGKIKLFLPEKNIGMMKMDVETWKLCTGEYIALLNGDDYWIDDHKLQTQVDFLESNSDTVMCFHKAKVINENTGYIFETVFPESGDTMTVEALLNGYNPIMTPTVMFRNVITFPDWYENLPYGDMPTYFLLAQKGKIRYIDKLMSVYRIHSSGQWQGEHAEKNLLKDLHFYEVMNEKLSYKFDYLIKKIFAQRYFDLSLCRLKNDDIQMAKQYSEKIKEYTPNYLDKNDIENLELLLSGNLNGKAKEELLSREIKWKVN